MIFNRLILFLFFNVELAQTHPCTTWSLKKNLIIRVLYYNLGFLWSSLIYGYIKTFASIYHLWWLSLFSSPFHSISNSTQTHLTLSIIFLLFLFWLVLILLCMWWYIRPQFMYDLVCLIAIREWLKLISALFASLSLGIYLYGLDDAKWLCFVNLCNIIQCYNNSLSDAHYTWIKTDIVLSEIHSTCVHDAWVVRATKVIEDYFFFWKGKQISNLGLRWSHIQINL